LFARVRRRISLTRAGATYLEKVRTALDALEAATFDLKAHGGAGGVLNISIPSTWGNMWLLPRFSRFVAAHPGIIVNLSTKVGRVDFSSGALDAAIVFGDGAIPGTSADFVMVLDLMPIASPDFLKRAGRVKSARDLLRLPLLHQMTVPGAWGAFFKASGLGDGIDVPGGSRYALLSMGMQATLAGLGIALLPMYLVRDELKSGRLCRVLPQTVRTAEAYYLHCPLEQRDLPALAAFRSWLLGEVATGDRLNSGVPTAASNIALRTTRKPRT
jgi:LysR family transcriptional regulator, glycine cleavage system transcriptional activator